MVVCIVFLLSMLIIKLSIDNTEDFEFLDDFFWITSLVFALNIAVVFIVYGLGNLALKTEQIVYILILITFIYSIIELLRKNEDINYYLITYFIVLILEIIIIYINLIINFGTIIFVFIIIYGILIFILRKKNIL